MAARFGTPQLSDEPLFTCEIVTLAVPTAFRNTVRFWQIAVGLVESVTVTMELQVDVFPELSVTVSLTEFVPVFAQEKEVIFNDMLMLPQLSILPLLMKAEVIVAEPVAPRKTLRF